VISIQITEYGILDISDRIYFLSGGKMMFIKSSFLMASGVVLFAAGYLSKSFFMEVFVNRNGVLVNTG
jgi:hypothetical protein